MIDKLQEKVEVINSEIKDIIDIKENILSELEFTKQSLSEYIEYNKTLENQVRYRQKVYDFQCLI